MTKPKAPRKAGKTTTRGKKLGAKDALKEAAENAATQGDQVERVASGKAVKDTYRDVKICENRSATASAEGREIIDTAARNKFLNKVAFRLAKRFFTAAERDPAKAARDFRDFMTYLGPAHLDFEGYIRKQAPEFQLGRTEEASDEGQEAGDEGGSAANVSSLDEHRAGAAA
jgi:hypothetical protein